MQAKAILPAPQPWPDATWCAGDALGRARAVRADPHEPLEGGSMCPQPVRAQGRTTRK